MWCVEDVIPEEEQRWSLFERHLHHIYICINLNESFPVSINLVLACVTLR